jgi:hypothetical protein
MMADLHELIRRGDGGEQESFLVECRSLSGFSGSPVFGTTTQFYTGGSAEIVRQARIREIGDNAKPSSSGVVASSIGGTFGPWLLGIDWGHIPLWKPVYESDGDTKTKYQVEAITGIACVVPTWRILQVLNLEELVKQREKDETETRKMPH